MNQQRGLLLELRDVKLDEEVEECPLEERGAAAEFEPAFRQREPAGQSHRGASNFVNVFDDLSVHM